MKGQASLEILLITIGVLTVSAGFFFYGQSNQEPHLAKTAAKTGIENSINKIEFKKSANINIKNLNINGDEIKTTLVFWGANISISSLEENVRKEALKHIYHALHGTYPETAQPVSTQYHIYDVTVNAKKVKK